MSRSPEGAVWHDRALVSAEDYGVRDKHTNRSSETNGRSLLFAAKYRLLTVVVDLLRGSSGTAVIRPKRFSCLGGVGPAAVNATLLPPRSLIKNEWWTVWVKGANGGSLSGGDTERVSVAELLDTLQTVVYSPEVTIKRAIKLGSRR